MNNRFTRDQGIGFLQRRSILVVGALGRRHEAVETAQQVLFAGLWLAIAHVGYAIACAVTIVGLPFAVAHLKLALLALRPFGKDVI